LTWGGVGREQKVVNIGGTSAYRIRSIARGEVNVGIAKIVLRGESHRKTSRKVLRRDT